MKIRKTPKPKKCGWSLCGKMFTPNPFRFNQQTCDNIMCAIGLVKEKESKKEAKSWHEEKRTIKAKLMSWSAHIKDLQDNYFNPYIRLRDSNEPCISCQTTRDVQYHAGHYMAAGNYSFLRFNEDNVHKQCGKNCNKELHGNLHEYRINLIKKIGLEKVIWLENNRHKELSLTIPEIIELKQVYKLKIKELKTNN